MFQLDMDKIVQPTLLLDEGKARENIATMSRKAADANVVFRPHFKTHQSAAVGEWYREEGVHKITVSSLDMAGYFAGNGWDDITVAFPVNLREIDKINALASKITLNLLVQSPESISFLNGNLKSEVGVWMKIDVGYHRAGVDPAHFDTIAAMGEALNKSHLITWHGLLAHTGHSYALRERSLIDRLFLDSGQVLNDLRNRLSTAGFQDLRISVGDTPGCSVAANWTGLDEIRCGNFVFYDAMQYVIGSCRPDQIAVAMACPVVAKYPERGELLLYGGAVHFSKDNIDLDGKPCYGLLTSFDQRGWGGVDHNEKIIRLSQEHGLARVSRETMEKTSVGDLVFVLPVHSCLTVDLMRAYLNTSTGGYLQCSAR